MSVAPVDAVMPSSSYPFDLERPLPVEPKVD